MSNTLAHSRAVLTTDGNVNTQINLRRQKNIRTKN
jgi:hypothetical protein